MSVDVAEAFDGQGRPAGLGGAVIVAADLFGPAAAGLLAARLVRVLEAAAGDPGAPAGAAGLLDRGRAGAAGRVERHRLRGAGRDGAGPVR